MMSTKKDKNSGFESSLNKLEEILESLETGNLSLEDSLKTYEKGVALTSQCQKFLYKAEQKVKILSEKEMQDNAEPSQLDLSAVDS